MNRTIVYISTFIFCIFFMSAKSFAGQCTTVKPNYMVTAGTIIVQHDTPQNSYMTQVIQSESDQVYAGCSGYNGGENDQIGIKSYNKVIGSIDGYAVFASNIPGVGYIIGSHASFIGSYGCSYGSDVQIIAYGQTTQTSCRISGNGLDGNSAWEQPFIRLVNMGAGAASGGSLSGTIGSIYGGNASQGWLPEVPVMINGVINVTSCAVNTPVVNVPLGDYLTSEFTEVNHSTEAKPVPITLNCNAGARINAVITAVPEPEGNWAGGIKLNPGGATGVGIQLLDKNWIGVKLNEKFVVDTVSGDGQYNFDWRAHYYQTKSTVTTGAANASVTMALTYE